MNRSEAADLARELMNANGLGQVPFEFDRSKRRVGCTHFHGGRLQKITLSAHWIQALPDEDIRDTILHEIAHGLCGAHHGHGAVWRRMARQVGAKPERCVTPSAEVFAAMAEIAPHAWVGTCPNGHTTRMHRAPGRVRGCTKCSPRFNTNYLFTWARDGVPVPLSGMPVKFQREMEALRQSGRLPAPAGKPKTLEDYFRF